MKIYIRNILILLILSFAVLKPQDSYAVGELAIRDLAIQILEPYSHGTVLRSLRKQLPEVIMATAAVGAIPFESNFDSGPILFDALKITAKRTDAVLFTIGLELGFENLPEEEIGIDDAEKMICAWIRNTLHENTGDVLHEDFTLDSQKLLDSYLATLTVVNEMIRQISKSFIDVKMDSFIYKQQKFSTYKMMGSLHMLTELLKRITNPKSPFYQDKLYKDGRSGTDIMIEFLNEKVKLAFESKEKKPFRSRFGMSLQYLAIQIFSAIQEIKLRGRDGGDIEDSAIQILPPIMENYVTVLKRFVSGLDEEFVDHPDIQILWYMSQLAMRYAKDYPPDPTRPKLGMDEFSEKHPLF